jgi:UDP-N-acetylmuramate dehydrogenase
MIDILRDRRMKFPLRQPNCGSVFLSSPELYSAFGPPGKIIEMAGLKGARVGDAQVSPKHANFIVNLGDARAEDVLRLIGRINCTVRNSIGAKLFCEVMYVASDGKKEKAGELSFFREQR